MNNESFSKTYLVQQPVDQIFNSLLNVREWWFGLYGETIEGSSEKVGDEFTFRAGGGAHYTKQKLVELIPNKKIAWLVTEGDLTFIDKTDEWVGTKISFEFTEKGDATEVHFTHEGLVPAIECYNECSAGWMGYLQKFLAPLEGK